MPGKSGYQPRAKGPFVLKMRDLGYMVEQQQESISMLMGVSIAQAEEIEALKTQLAEVAKRQPTHFIKA